MEGLGAGRLPRAGSKSGTQFAELGQLRDSGTRYPIAGVDLEFPEDCPHAASGQEWT